MTDFARYFLAIIPPTTVLEEVRAIKKHFHDQYNCKAPLRSPAHITLHMPFTRKEKKEPKLLEKLSEFAVDQENFDLSLNGFSAFAPRTIYIAVDENPGLLAFQKGLIQCAKRELNIFSSDYKGRAYHAHMTVAFRDLKKALFPQAWSEFKGRPFTATFTVSSFWLLKHDGKEWQLHTEIPF